MHSFFRDDDDTSTIVESKTMTFDQAVNLRPGQTIYHVDLRNADKTPLRARVNGKIKRWKRDPSRFEIPMKHGLRHCFYLRETDLDSWTIEG